MENQNWDIVIKSDKKWGFLSVKQIVRYKDLLFLFVKRDLTSVYKQTILGPLWFVLQPVLTAFMYLFVFGAIAGLSTDGMPQFLFYLSGITLWNYFAECLTKTSDTFAANVQLFGKVYFPRIVVPLSVTVSSLVKFCVSFLLFIIVLVVYMAKGEDLQPNVWLLMVPVLVLITAGLGLGFGLLISSMTARYRDLKFLVQFGVQLMMFFSPVIYPLSTVQGKWQTVLLLNPMTSVIEAFKYAFTGHGMLLLPYLLYSFAFMVVVLLTGGMSFSRVEKNFMDTV